MPHLVDMYHSTIGQRITAPDVNSIKYDHISHKVLVQIFYQVFMSTDVN